MKRIVLILAVFLFSCETSSDEKSTTQENVKPELMVSISPTVSYVDSLIQISIDGTKDDRDSIENLTFEVKWSDAGAFTTITNIQKIQHAYDTHGNYTITVRVTDTGELTDEKKVTVTILEHAISSIDAASVFLIGHSLVNFDMPKMLNDIAADLNKTHTYDLQIANGSPLKWNWNQSHTTQGSNSKTTIPNGNFDVLVITEAVPLQNHLTWSDTYLYASKFDSLARAHEPNVRTYIYETWHCINDSCAYEDRVMPWREKLDKDLKKWEHIVDSVKVMNTTDNIYLLPAGQAMALLNDKIISGEVPGYTSYREFFVDDIHLNDIGNYFIALVQYATIYGADPTGAVHQVKDEWGGDYDAPSESLAEVLQKIAWEAVTKYKSN